MSTDPLAGTRILDLTTVIMGPYATHIMADLGAEVIKVEAPEGDAFRQYGPSRSEGMGGSVLQLHRNKHSLGGAEHVLAFEDFSAAIVVLELSCYRCFDLVPRQSRRQHRQGIVQIYRGINAAAWPVCLAKGCDDWAANAQSSQMVALSGDEGARFKKHN